MSKTNLSNSQILRKKSVLSVSLTILLIVISIFGFSVYFKASGHAAEDKQITADLMNEQQALSCCSQPNGFAAQTYTLLGTYYSLKNNQKSILMFNNKGPAPLVTNPSFFALSGQRLDLPAVTVPPMSYQEVDLKNLLANHLPQFEEGSVQVTHQGAKLQLGVQVKILNPERGLIFDEQFVQTSRFVSSRLENVWWLPSSQTETKLIVSNTTDSPLSATITVNGTLPRQEQPVVIQLNPHQTRALDILRDLAGREQGGTIHKEGGISIAHSGAPGAILARMLVSKESTGFSSVADFVDPQATRSSKWNGSGYRIGKIGNEELTPIVVARNIGSDPTVVSGRLSYTNDSGEVVFINVPAVRVNANDTKMIDVERAVRQSNVPANITDTGFEFEYSTLNGTVIMTALSVSRSENQVFRVPLFDPQRMASSAGGYPWKADGDYTTMLYIKNETDQPQQYTATLIYEGGNYATGIKDIKPHQLITIDFRALRDNQTPDAKKQTIPLTLERGEIAWSSHGETNKALSGRSHQSSVAEGVSSTYDCRNCCPDNDIYTGASIPGFIYAVPDDIYPFQAEMTTENCLGTFLSTFPVDVYGWVGNSLSVATIESDGMATAISEGEAFFNVDNLSSYRWIIPPGSTQCERLREFTSASGGMNVVQRQYRGSIQAQGPDINYGNRRVDLGDNVFGSRDTVSRAWAQDIPLGDVTGIRFANLVKSKLTSTQQYNREQAFDRAIDFIRRCGQNRGCDPPGQSFGGLNGTRVDVVINAGTNFVPEFEAIPELDQLLLLRKPLK